MPKLSTEQEAVRSLIEGFSDKCQTPADVVKLLNNLCDVLYDGLNDEDATD